MKVIIKSIGVVVIATIMLLSTACSDNASDMKNAIENRDSEALIGLINSSLEENKNVEEMNQLLDESFTELTGTPEYENFVFVEKVRDGINDSPTKENISKILSDNGKNKVMSFLSGTWIRKDGTDMDGTYGDISWNDDSGVMVLKSVSDAINPERFNENDLKWNNISVIDANTIKGEDLTKAEGVGEYKAFTGNIDYDDNMIFIQTIDDSTDYAKGNNQTWMLKSYYDSFEGKQVLTDDDFKISGDEYDNEDFIINELKDHLFYYMYYDPEYDKSEEGVITTHRGIKLGFSKTDVIEKYGIGSYAKFDKDADIIRFSDGDVPKTVKKAEYSLQYRGKDKKGKRLFFYFDKNDKVVAVFYGVADYASMLKEATDE